VRAFEFRDLGIQTINYFKRNTVKKDTYAFPRAKFDVLRVIAEVPATTSRLWKKKLTIESEYKYGVKPTQSSPNLGKRGILDQF
jgi:hypothetical protein